MRRTRIRHPHRAPVSVPFNAGRGLMPAEDRMLRVPEAVSVPFNAGRGLMLGQRSRRQLQLHVSVPFNAGRGLMPSSED